VVDWTVWVGFLAVVLAALAVDLLLHRGPISTRVAALFSAAWIALGLAFAGVVAWLLGPRAAGDYLAGYLIEKSLSVDNLFVFLLVFRAFGVPQEYQHRALFYGVVGALAFRGVFVALGAYLLARFSWVAIVFGLVLLASAARLGLHREGEVHPEQGALVRWIRRQVPMTDDYAGGVIAVRRDGQLLFTPMLPVIVALETTDIVFAVDSIPAIFGVTRDTFIVYTSNAFALLGLRSLYFLLADAVRRFRYLHHALVAILAFIGLKLIYEEVVHLAETDRVRLLPDALLWHVPSAAPLVIVGALLLAGIAASLAAGDGPVREDAEEG
jgi:tellurite resistance protein TerC